MMRKNSIENNGIYINPIATAVALIFTGPAVVSAADEVMTLPETSVKVHKESKYAVEKSANQKFTSSLKDTPKSVTVITEDLIRDTGSNTFQDALRTTPGITFRSGEGGSPAYGDRPFIRGFDAASAIFVDGVRDLGSQTREVFAIEQVEVLKGASGAFDGRGSAGGSINVVTKKAKEGNFTAGSIGFGTDQYRRATFDGNYMIGDDAAIRLVGMVHDADVPDRDHVDNKRWGFMPSITLGLNGPTSLTASWYHLETDDMADRGLPINPNTGRPASIGRDTFFGLKNADFLKTNADIGTLEFKHAFSDNLEIRNISRYGSSKLKYFTQAPSLSAAGVYSARSQGRHTETETLSNVTELSISFDTGSIKHHANVGFEWSQIETDQYGYSAFRNGVLATYGTAPTVRQGFNISPFFANVGAYLQSDIDVAWTDKTSTTTGRSRAFYAFDSIELNEQWLVNAGLRWDKFSAHRNDLTAANADGTSDHSFLNGQLGVVYKVTPQANVYASYATAATPMGLDNGDTASETGTLSNTTQNLRPERSKTFEVGTKIDVLDGLSLSGALFYTQKYNARIATVNTSTYENAGEVEVKGIELGATGKISDKWNVFAGYTHLKNELTKAIGSSAGNEGNDLQGVSRNSATVWTTYDILPELSIGGGAFYMDKVYTNAANTTYLPSYVRWDAMANYKVSEKVNLQLNLQNLTDKRYFNNGYNNFAVVAPGRLAFVSLNFKF